MPKHEFTKEEDSRISKLLSKKLAPEYISYRTGFGRGMVAYVEGWTIISLANQIFGFNGWSSSITRMGIDYCDLIDGKFNVGITCTTRITLKDGSSREDVGFGSSENQRSKSQAYEKARKEASTDALKRALRLFGNALGNCCYDKEFINTLNKIEKKERDIITAKDLYRRENNIKQEHKHLKKSKSRDVDEEIDVSCDIDGFSLS
ncbi:DNA repair and recombination protein rti1 [Nosema granulosis]|uniref:DNA repair and recombination protein rti1 n=1 Tax=Nosema granulosis TaxID=83296 RepID=A0A9P6KXS5_9MICR|nr:DNA repair and recombination protein rti1 [Nosema granulosis]